MLENWNEENVTVNLSLTPEAARILSQYAGERSRGKFVSALLVAQRQRDDQEAERIRNRVVTDLRTPNPADKFHLGGHKTKKKKAHR
jgi:hypothetical protein